MNEEFLTQLFTNLLNPETELTKNYIPINSFRCIYNKKLLPCFINFLRTNKWKYQKNPNRYYKIKRFLQKFLKHSEKRKLDTIWAEEFSLEIDFFLEGKCSLNLKSKSMGLEIVSFFKACKEKNVESIQESLNNFKRINGMDVFKVFELVCNIKNYFNLKVISIRRVEILEAINNLYCINMIDHIAYQKMKDEENRNKEVKKKYLENIKRAIEYLSNLIEKNQPSQIQKSNNKLFMKMIEDFLQKNFNFDKYSMTEVRFICFGSYSNGFALRDSDIDAIILTNNYLDERTILNDLSYKLKTLEEYNYSILTLAKETIRVPLIRIENESQSEKMDLVVNNILGSVNTKLLKTYSLISPICLKLGIIVKIWGKTHDLISQKAISSYAIILMVIYFLQIKKILPSIQKIGKENLLKDQKEKAIIRIKRMVRNGQVETFETNLHFEHDIEKIKEYMRNNNFIQEENINLFQLFIDFLIFYKQDGVFINTNMRCNIKKGDIDFKIKKEEDNYLYSIKDPFDKTHNPGDRLSKQKHWNICERFLSSIDETLKYLNSFQLEKVFDI